MSTTQDELQKKFADIHYDMDGNVTNGRLYKELAEYVVENYISKAEVREALDYSERMAWNDEDGTIMDVKVFENNIVDLLGLSKKEAS